MFKKKGKFQRKWVERARSQQVDITLGRFCCEWKEWNKVGVRIGNEWTLLFLFCFDLTREKSSLCVQWERWNMKRKMMMHQSKGRTAATVSLIANGWDLIHRWRCRPKSEVQTVHSLQKREGRANMPRCSKREDVTEWACVQYLITSCFSVKWKLNSSKESEDDERGIEDFRRETIK